MVAPVSVKGNRGYYPRSYVRTPPAACVVRWSSCAGGWGVVTAAQEGGSPPPHYNVDSGWVSVRRGPPTARSRGAKRDDGRKAAVPLAPPSNPIIAKVARLEWHLKDQMPFEGEGRVGPSGAFASHVRGRSSTSHVCAKAALCAFMPWPYGNVCRFRLRATPFA